MIRDLDDDALVAHYWALRRLAHDMSSARNPRLGRVLRDLDITVAVARKRRLDISAR